MVAAMWLRSLLLASLLTACGSPAPAPAPTAWKAVPSPKPPHPTHSLTVRQDGNALVAQTEAGPVRLPDDPSAVHWDGARFAVAQGPLLAITPARGCPYLAKGSMPGKPLSALPHPDGVWTLQVPATPSPSSPPWKTDAPPASARDAGHPSSDPERDVLKTALGWIPALGGPPEHLDVALAADLDRDGADEGLACLPAGPHRCWVLDFAGPELQLREATGPVPDGPLQAVALTAPTGTWVRLQGQDGAAVLRDAGADYVIESITPGRSDADAPIRPDRPTDVGACVRSSLEVHGSGADGLRDSTADRSAR